MNMSGNHSGGAASQRARTTTIGAFVILAVGLLIGGIVIFGSGRLFKPTVAYVAYFNSRLKGLGIGSPVMFRGVRVGSVADITIDVNDHNSLIVPVIFEIEPERFGNLHTALRSKAHARAAIDRLIREKGLRARLEIDSIVTGQMMIELDFDPETEARYRAPSGGLLPEFPTVRSTVEQLTATLRELPVRDIMFKLQGVIEGLDSRINDRRVDKTLDAATEAVTRANDLVADLDAEVLPRLTEGIDEIAELARHLRLESVGRLDRALDSASGLMDATQGELPAAMAELRRALEEVTRLAGEASEMLGQVRTTASDDSRLMLQLDAALREIGQAARAVAQAADYLQRHPESLLRGKDAP